MIDESLEPAAPDSPSDEELLTVRTLRVKKSPLKVFAGPIIFAGILCAGLATVICYGQAGEDPRAAHQASGGHELAEAEMVPRLLQSEELTRAVAEHTLRFAAEGGAPIDALSDEECGQLLEDLRHTARAQGEIFARELEKRDAAAARQLRELQLEPTVWRHSTHILQALHDQRVQRVGGMVSKTVVAAKEAGASPEQTRQLLDIKLSEHAEELQVLRKELFPAQVQHAQSGRGHWEVALGVHGVQAKMELNGWQAEVQVSAPRRLLAAPIPMTTTPEPNFFKKLSIMLTGHLGMIWATVISVVTTVMTLIGSAHSSKLFWGVQGLMDGIVCTASFGNMVPWTNWIPCMIPTFFFGIEAIWTWVKQ